MKLKLKKSTIKNLSKDVKKVPVELTPQVAGGAATIDGTIDATYRDCADTYTATCGDDTVAL